MRFRVIPCATQPGKAMNFTITRKMQQNATPCNIFELFHPSRDPARPPVGNPLSQG